MLKIKKISKVYGERTAKVVALNHVSFHVSEMVQVIQLRKAMRDDTNG